jgi:large subunit ribosomal protein L25
MRFVALTATARPRVGKQTAKQLRAAQRIPAIVYGGPGGPVAVAVPQRALVTLLRAQGGGRNALVELTIEGAGDGARQVLLKATQADPVSGALLHADFQEIRLDRKLRVGVPIRVVGEAIGVKAKGGLLTQSLRELMVECLPTAIPEAVPVDVAQLDLGHAIHVRDLTAPPGVRILEEPDRAVVAVTSPMMEEAAAPAAAVPEGEAPAEPEVVGRREASPEGEEAEKPERGKEREPRGRDREK